MWGNVVFRNWIQIHVQSWKFYIFTQETSIHLTQKVPRRFLKQAVCKYPTNVNNFVIYILLPKPCPWMRHLVYVWKLWGVDCGMGPWLVLVSPCFRENVVAVACKTICIAKLYVLHTKSTVPFVLACVYVRFWHFQNVYRFLNHIKNIEI